MKKKLIRCLVVLVIISGLVVTGVGVLAVDQIDNEKESFDTFRFVAPDAPLIITYEREVPIQLSKKGTFQTESHITQEGLSLELTGDFTWTPGKDIACLGANGIVRSLPEGWTVEKQELSVVRSSFGWREGVRWVVHIRTKAQYRIPYTLVLNVTKNGELLTWG